MSSILNLKLKIAQRWHGAWSITFSQLFMPIPFIWSLNWPNISVHIVVLEQWAEEWFREVPVFFPKIFLNYHLIWSFRNSCNTYTILKPLWAWFVWRRQGFAADIWESYSQSWLLEYTRCRYFWFEFLKEYLTIAVNNKHRDKGEGVWILTALVSLYKCVCMRLRVITVICVIVYGTVCILFTWTWL